MSKVRWTKEEKARMMDLYELYGKDFDRYQKYLPTRTKWQISAYYHNNQFEMNREMKRRRGEPVSELQLSEDY